MTIKIGIVDDHQLFLESLVALLESNNIFKVVLKSLNGNDLQDKLLKTINEPDIMLVDVNMPEMDGYQTTLWLKANYPNIKIVALSMKDDERTIIKMLKAGCISYLLKDIHPDELERALLAIQNKGYYNGESKSNNPRKLLIAEADYEAMKITDAELIFLKFACSDMTYKEIATKMNENERKIDKYREHLFEKFKVQSRVGLCMAAIKKGIVEL